MLFNSVDFLVFFPVTVLVYFILPEKVKNIWLLAASYYFYMCWNVRYVLLLFFSTAVTYVSGLLLGMAEKRAGASAGRWKKLLVGASFAVNLSLLGYFKYFNFFLENIGKALARIGIVFSCREFDILLPVGISFFIFQALSYTMDVYRGNIPVQKNFLQYALFVSFFPQLVAGPIERSKDLIPQIAKKHPFSVENVKNGLLLMGWGLFLKMVIADRIAIFVDQVYGDVSVYGGTYIAVATILFAFQIYCDFAGYSTIATGAAQVLGFHLTDNFRSPYCALSVREFWKRWHISLTRWFTDYLYIPMGGNRKGKFRKYINIIVVFGVSGLWHGARWSYVIWGLLNGIMMIAGEVTAPVRNKIRKLLCWKEEAVSNKILQAVITFLLIDFTWLFFRSAGTAAALVTLKQMFAVKNMGILLDGSLYNLGLNQRNFMLMTASIALLMVVDILHERGISIRKWLEKQNLWFRWLSYMALILSIVVFGIWGVGYDKTAFIYFQF